jgi:hypothetical protein
MYFDTSLKTSRRDLFRNILSGPCRLLPPPTKKQDFLERPLSPKNNNIHIILFQGRVAGNISTQEVCSMFIKTDKAKDSRGGGKRCRCYERRRSIFPSANLENGAPPPTWKIFFPCVVKMLTLQQTVQ